VTLLIRRTPIPEIEPLGKFINMKILFSYSKKMEILKMSSRGQVVIPQQLRNELGLEEGAIIGIEKVNDIAIIKKIDVDLVNQFENSLEDLKKGRVKRIA